MNKDELKVVRHTVSLLSSTASLWRQQMSEDANREVTATARELAGVCRTEGRRISDMRNLQTATQAAMRAMYMLSEAINRLEGPTEFYPAEWEG